MKRWWKQGLALVLIVTTATAATAIWLRLPRTHELARLAKPMPGTAYRHIMDYNWLDNSTLLTFQNWSGMEIPGNTTLEAFAINVATGKSFPMPVLNPVLKGDYSGSLCSPNDVWLLSQKTVRWGKDDNEGMPENEADIISAVKVDGSCCISHKINRREWPLNRIGWLDNSRYALYSWRDDKGLIIHIYDVNKTGIVSIIHVRDPQKMINNQVESVSSEPHWATTPQQHLLLMGSHNLINEPIAICDVDLNFQSAPIQQKTILLPKGAYVPYIESDIIPSPDGKRIAWILQFEDRYTHPPNPLEQFWTVYIRHQPKLVPVSIPTEEIWVSSIDGRGMHQIAYQIETADNRISNMEWASDGKSLSYKRSWTGNPGEGYPIYTIPIN